MSNFELNWVHAQVLGRDIYTCPEFEGQIVHDKKSGVVMTLFGELPSEAQIQGSIGYEKRLPSHFALEESDFEARFLLAEKTALYSVKPVAHICDSPFSVFPLIEGKHACVVESVYESSYGRNEPSYAIFLKRDDWLRYEELFERFKKINSETPVIERWRVANGFHHLTGIDTERRYTVYHTQSKWSGWQEALIRPIDDIDFDDLTAYGYMSCHSCRFQDSFMYNGYDRGDRLAKMHRSWHMHQEKHDGCEGDFYFG